jgi:hypothetical protein
MDMGMIICGLGSRAGYVWGSVIDIYRVRSNMCTNPVCISSEAKA